MRKFGPVGALPARHQPVGRVECDGVYAAQLLRSILRNAAQHGVDQSRIAPGSSVCLHEPHRQVDRCVVGHVEPQAEEMAQRAEPAQHGRDQPAGQRPVAVRQRSKAGMCAAAVELVVQWPTPAEHAFEDVGRDPARCEALRR